MRLCGLILEGKVAKLKWESPEISFSVIQRNLLIPKAAYKFRKGVRNPPFIIPELKFCTITTIHIGKDNYGSLRHYKEHDSLKSWL
jgi:hypothetical protein